MADELQEMATDKLQKVADDIADTIVGDKKNLLLEYLDSPKKVLDTFSPWTNRGRDEPRIPGNAVRIKDLRGRLEQPAKGQRKVIQDKIRQATEELIDQDPLKSFVVAYRERQETDIPQMADLIISHPKSRGDYFTNGEKVLARHVPENRYRRAWRWLWGFRVNDGIRRRRLALAAKIQEEIGSDSRLTTAKEAFFETESFLKQAMQNPETSFRAVFLMSVAAFAAGVLLLVGAALAAIFLEDPVISGLAGGGGVVTTLVAVLRGSSNQIRTMNSDNARIRLILTDFAMEITHVRAQAVTSFKDAKEQNAELRELTKDAVFLLPSDQPPAAQGEAAESKPSLRQRILQRLTFWRPAS